MCEITGCIRKHYARGLCKRHYSSLNKKSIRERVNNGSFKGYRKCNLSGCSRKHEARGLCSMHYLRLLRLEKRISNGRRPVLVRLTNAKCAVPSCENKHHARGYCSQHYSLSVRLERRLTDNDIISFNRKQVPKCCEVNECGKIAKIKSLCYTHHYRKSRGIDLNIPVGKVPRKPYITNVK